MKALSIALRDTLKENVYIRAMPLRIRISQPGHPIKWWHMKDEYGEGRNGNEERALLNSNVAV